MLLSNLVLSACGVDLKSPEEIVGEFKVRAAAKGIEVQDVHVSFGSVGAHAAACLADGSIKIDKQYWNESTNSKRELLLYHELGHCALGKSHGAGIMNAVLTAPLLIEFENNKEELVDGLFETN